MRALLSLVALFALALPQLNVSQPSPINLQSVGGSAVLQSGGAQEHIIIPTTISGAAMSASAKATLTTSVNVKASAGNVYGVFAMNGAASTCWIQFINSASTGTLGTGVIFSVPLPASTTQPVWITLPYPVNLSTGIAIGIATTATGSSACGTGGNVVVFFT